MYFLLSGFFAIVIAICQCFAMFYAMAPPPLRKTSLCPRRTTRRSDFEDHSQTTNTNKQQYTTNTHTHNTPHKYVNNNLEDHSGARHTPL